MGKFYAPRWPSDTPIIDAISPSGDFDAVTGALSSVGLGSVPTWLRPYPVLSNGEKFRATLARLVCEAPNTAVVDEFSSVVDRQIAKVGAGAFAKAWRRTGGKVVLLSCHYDILDWVEPDWVFDAASGQFNRGLLWRRPHIGVRIYQTNGRFWPLFEPHHYLRLNAPIAATYYVATVNNVPVAHIAISPRPGVTEARACRVVVLPEWQGLGIGMRFLTQLARLWAAGKNRFNKPLPLMITTSHPGLAHALRKDKEWTQITARLHGEPHKVIATAKTGAGGVFGGHFRATQSFRYLVSSGQRVRRSDAIKT